LRNEYITIVVHNTDLVPEYNILLFGVVKEDFSHNCTVPTDTLDVGLKLTTTIVIENAKYSIEYKHGAVSRDYTLVRMFDIDELRLPDNIDLDSTDLLRWKETLLQMRGRPLKIVTLDGEVLENVTLNSLTHSVNEAIEYTYNMVFTEFLVAEVDYADIKITRKKKRNTGKASNSDDNANTGDRTVTTGDQLALGFAEFKDNFFKNVPWKKYQKRRKN